MRISATERAVAVVERAKRERRGTLSITLGTGCCESTAPFLYEDYYTGPGHEVVGEVASVPVMAPELLRDLYEEDELVIDVVEEFAESFSIETEWEVRLVLRGHEDGVVPERCDTAHEGPRVEPRISEQGTPIELPDHLRDIRIR